MKNQSESADIRKSANRSRCRAANPPRAGADRRGRPGTVHRLRYHARGRRQRRRRPLRSRIKGDRMKPRRAALYRSRITRIGLARDATSQRRMTVATGDAAHGQVGSRS
ncbi:hypothetical protein E1181_30055 [Saccharopolyspora terrae]|uniref:Uncharacterized protein n=1 Tax=Saccharopolyspora terrae TaxID=2530384 RepID=A0A4V6PCH1_9PSEU|nr:hypothetical protein E1181_30055 [Saccharopolyspora terrae]